MRFYLKMLATLIGVLLVVFVGMQVYTSKVYCKGIYDYRENQKPPTVGITIPDNRKTTEIFYSPTQKSCYYINGAPGAEKGRTLHKIDLYTENSTAISQPSQITKVLNILGFGPQVKKEPITILIPSPTRCLGGQPCFP